MDRGVDLAVIASLMGHRSPTETGVYLHVLPGLNPVGSLLELGVGHEQRMPIRPWLTIPPKGFATGEILIEKRVGSLDQALEEQDVVVFWFAQVESIDGRSYGPQGGFVLIPHERSQ
jgi:hypothetical protein